MARGGSKCSPLRCGRACYCIRESASRAPSRLHGCVSPPSPPSHVSRANLRPIAISFLTSNRRLSWQRFSRCHSIAGVTPVQPASSWRVHICVCVVGGGGGGSGVCQAPTKRLAHRHTPPATHKYVLPSESNNFAVRWAQNPSLWQAHSTQVSSVSHPITTVSPVPCT